MLLQVDAHFNESKLNEARFSSHMAKKLNMIGLILGLFTWSVFIVVTVITLSLGLTFGLTANEDEYYQ